MPKGIYTRDKSLKDRVLTEEERKERHRTRQRNYYRQNPEKFRARKKEYYLKNPEHYKEYWFKSHIKNRLQKIKGLPSEIIRFGFCDICKQKKKLVVDHCHKTNTFRGFVCNRCNLVLGLAEDSVFIINQAKNYLNRA